MSRVRDKQTVLRDAEKLSRTHPVVTVTGRCGGGVKPADRYHPTHEHLSFRQVALLKKLGFRLQGEDLQVLNSIIDQFSA